MRSRRSPSRTCGSSRRCVRPDTRWSSPSTSGTSSTRTAATTSSVRSSATSCRSSGAPDQHRGAHRMARRPDGARARRGARRMGDADSHRCPQLLLGRLVPSTPTRAQRQAAQGSSAPRPPPARPPSCSSPAAARRRLRRYMTAPARGVRLRRPPDRAAAASPREEEAHMSDEHDPRGTPDAAGSGSAPRRDTTRLLVRGDAHDLDRAGAARRRPDPRRRHRHQRLELPDTLLDTDVGT